MTFQSSLSWVAVLLVILNALTAGWVADEITKNVTGPLGATAAQTAECTYAVMYANPRGELFGFQYPIPSGDDAALALALFSILYFSGIARLGARNAVLLLLGIWFAVRLLAAYFAASVPGCAALVDMAGTLVSPFYWVSVIAIPFIIIRFLRK